MHIFGQEPKVTPDSEHKSMGFAWQKSGQHPAPHSVSRSQAIHGTTGDQPLQAKVDTSYGKKRAESVFSNHNFSQVPIHTKQAVQQAPQVTPILSTPEGLSNSETYWLHSSLHTSGQSLPEDVRQSFESRFGHNFSDVRIHTDPMAQKTALSLQARAFTAGRHIGFGPRQYHPHSYQGQRLLAHELAHVVQQTRDRSPSKSQEALEQDAATAARTATGQGPIHLAEGQATYGLLQFDRAPDLVHNGLHTFYLGADRFSRVMAIQIGIQSQAQRVTLQVAALTSGLHNPSLPERSMVLAISPTAPLAPRIIGETEVELPQGDIFQKTFEIQLNTDPDTPIVSVVMRYGQPREAVPFPEGGFGVWRPMRVETGWIGVNDGLRQLNINFPTEIPGSLWSSEWRPFVHPGLGQGFINSRTRQFQPYPLGRPSLRAQEEAIRTTIHLIPVVGSLVMAGEALVGRSIWGRPLSTTERVILGAGALLAEIGPIMRAGSATVRTATAVSRLTTVTSLSRVQALRLVIGSRYLTEAEMTTLQRLATQVRAGTALSEADQVLIGRLMGKLNEGARAGALRAEVAATTGTARQSSRFTDLGGRTSADETRVGEALARDLNADVVRAPESTSTGVRTGDYLIDDVFAEAYSPRTGNIENLLRQATSKHQQAGMLVIDLTHTPLASSEVVGSAGRIFGRPEAADLYRIIYVDGNRIVADVLRPAVVPGSQVPGVFVRGAASAAAAEAPR